MIKNLVRWSQVVNSREYQVLCDCDSPLSDLKEVAYELIKYIGKVEDQVKEQQSKADADKQTSEVLKEDKPPEVVE